VQFQLRVKLWSNKVKRSVLYLAVQLHSGFVFGYKMKQNPSWGQKYLCLQPSINPSANSERTFAWIYSLNNALYTPLF